jgi:hypothetical protein
MSTTLYLFLDTETTGLEDGDQIWQLAWILEDAHGNEISRRNRMIAHSRNPSPWVLQNTAYVDVCSKTEQWSPSTLLAEMTFLRKLVRDRGLIPSKDVYLVGAVPSFDDQKIRKIVTPQWHHHLICIEVLIMGAFGLEVPPKLGELEKLTGVTNARPHDALADAQHVRDLFHWLRTKNAALQSGAA